MSNSRASRSTTSSPASFSSVLSSRQTETSPQQAIVPMPVSPNPSTSSSNTVFASAAGSIADSTSPTLPSALTESHPNGSVQDVEDAVSFSQLAQEDELPRLDSEGDSESEEEDEDEEDEPLDEEGYLNALLSRAYANAESKAEEDRARKAGEEMVLTMEETVKEPKLPMLTAPALPAPYLSFHQQGKFSIASRTSSSKLSKPRDALSTATKANAEVGLSKRAPELDTIVIGRTLSKKQAQAERKATAPLAWGDLPAIREDRRKDMVKEYHALKLRNSLDPKRFYKGQGSIKHVPEVFAIGKIHSQSKVLQSTTLRSEAYDRPGSILKELMVDDESQAYAKRKFGDLQATRSYNGRKKVVKKPRRN